MHTIVIAGSSTKALLTSFFSLIPILPAQDMSVGAQTHLGAAHTHFGSCYGGFGLVPSVHCKPKSTITLGPKHVWASSIFFEKKMAGDKGTQGKKEASNPFVLPCNNTYLYAHIMLRVMEVLVNIIKSFTLTLSSGK